MPAPPLHRPRARRVVSLALLVAALHGVAHGAAEPDRSAWESGWHVVRPGDTLEGLAERFLGSAPLWRELHGLNPWIRDPDLLLPGQRLRIFLERPTPEPSAQIVATSRKVSELPRPAPWRPANEGDVLLEKDGLRTERAASARLRFDDGATLTLTEDSLVFLRRQTRSSAPAPRKEIEIELGQVDVESSAGASNRDTIEVVVGAASSVGVADGGKPLKARSRRAESSAAQFMIYDGRSTVSAAGATVEVEAGSGTTVAPKSPPAPPEALLPAPTGLEPPAGGELDRSAPALAWNAVPGAASYVVEICRDSACGGVVEVAHGIMGPSFAPREHLEGTLHWRVTAVAPSGLDGFPSPTQALVPVDSVAPPAPIVSLRDGDGAAIAPGSCVDAIPDATVVALDRSGAPLPWELLVDGRPLPLAELQRLPLAGSHRIAAQVTDGRGRTATSPEVPFVVDRAAPWIELAAATVSSSEPPRERRSRRGRRERPVAACDSGLEVRDAANAWRPVPCSTGAAPDALAVALSTSGPAAELRVAQGQVRIGGRPLAAGESLHVEAWDVGCGLSTTAVWIAPSRFDAGRMLFVAEIADFAGNRRTVGWHLTRAPG